MSIPNSPFGLLPNAPIQTHLVSGDRSVMPPWGGWLNHLRQWLFLNIPTIINSAGVFASADAVANGAFGDGVHDDSAVLQQTLNATGGVLYLRPGLTFLCGTTLSVTSGSQVVIYGGGTISNNSGTTALSITAAANVFIRDIKFLGNSNQTLLLINQNTQWRQIENCFFSGPGGIGIAIQNNAVATEITACLFQSNLNTGIALTISVNVNIVNCTFVSGITNTITTSGACTYNVAGCNIPLHLYAEYTGTSTVLSTVSFTDIPNCSVTITLAGTWFISANASYVQTQAGTTGAITMRFAKNGTGDTRNASNPNNTLGITTNMGFLLSLSVGDVIKLQATAVTLTGSVLGSANNNMTNLCAIYTGN